MMEDYCIQIDSEAGFIVVFNDYWACETPHGLRIVNDDLDAYFPADILAE